MADSDALGGAKPVVWISVFCESCQLLLDAIVTPFLSTSLSVGSANAPGTLKGGCPKVGPSPRITTSTLLLPPLLMNPPMVTEALVPTNARVETLTNSESTE